MGQGGRAADSSDPGHHTEPKAFQSVVGGASRPSAPTADADTGAGLRGSIDVGERSAGGGVTTAPSKDDYPSSPTNRS